MLIPEWVLGITFQVIGSFFSNLGVNVQKYSHIKRQEMSPSDPYKSLPYYRTPLWLIGFGLFCFGEICAGIAMGYATQSVLAVLSSYSLILNGIFSMVLTGSKITTNYIRSSLIIMFGSILVILSTTHHKQQYAISDLGHLFRSIPFIIFLLFLILFLGALFIIRSVIPKNPTLLTTISAFMACISVLLAKCTMQLVKRSFLEDEPVNQFFISIWPWIIMASFGIFAALNVHFMNLALQVSSTTHVYPLYYSSSTILVILNGMLFFQEYQWFTFFQSIVFSIGVSICLTGVTSLREEEEHQYDIIPTESPLDIPKYPPNYYTDKDTNTKFPNSNDIPMEYQPTQRFYSNSPSTSTSIFSPTPNSSLQPTPYSASTPSNYSGYQFDQNHYLAEQRFLKENDDSNSSTPTYYDDEPSVNVSYDPLFQSKTSQQHDQKQQQQQQQPKQQQQQHSTQSKQPKTRVVRHSQQNSRLTAFFESQGNM